MVRLQPLELCIGVRVPASQPNQYARAGDELARSPSMKAMPAKALTTVCLGIVLLPVIAFAQLQTPAEQAEVALRARVNEFLQYHVDGNFRKAYEMVADDTKDEYFNTGKARLTDFKIIDIKFTDNFTKAAVTATMSKTISVLGQDMPISSPSTTNWKIENGKWVWYSDVKVASVNPISVATPFGAAAPTPPVKSNDGGIPGLPKDLDEKSIANAAKNILQQLGIDKKEATLAVDKPSDDKVVFHNGMPGSVQLELSAPEIPGLTAKLEQSIVRSGGDVSVLFHYEPAVSAQRRDPVIVQLVVQPTNQTFAIRINFAGPVPASPK
jgi:hypothetical protein